MGRPPYDDPDTLDLMRSDAAFAMGSVTHDKPNVPVAEQCLHGFPPAAGAGGFEVPSDAVALGELHFHLE
jgi:hypothetical protein